MMRRFSLRPTTLREANAFVRAHHRHHKPARGYKLALGLLEHDRLVGVVMLGRPVGRGCDPVYTAEVTRLCTDGTKDACSALYGAAARAAQAQGFRKIQTYILASEPGTTLKAAGWRQEATVRGRTWDHTTERQLRLEGGTRRTDQPTEDKVRWAKEFR